MYDFIRWNPAKKNMFKDFDDSILQKLSCVADVFLEILLKNSNFLQLDLGGCIATISKFSLRWELKS